MEEYYVQKCVEGCLQKNKYKKVMWIVLNKNSSSVYIQYIWVLHLDPWHAS